MKQNMGTTDRVIRILAAVIILGLYATNVVSGTLGIVLLIAAIIFIITSLLNFCPLYLPFDISTRKKEQQ